MRKEAGLSIAPWPRGYLHCFLRTISWGGGAGVPAVVTLFVSTGWHFQNGTLGVPHVTHASGRSLKTCDSTEENPEP